jgi:NitT/TauT family transport system ATP-binding protein
VSIPLSVAFLPLTDCAVLVAAKELGFAAAEGIDLALVRETSWATARDHLVYRKVQAAHLLAPLAVGVSLGLSERQVALAAPFKLNLNGNQVILSCALMLRLGIAVDRCVADPAGAAAAVAEMIRADGSRLRIGVVHRLSSHALMLRYWLASAGITAERDLEFSVLPPSSMAEALAAGEIDGFCAGEPWGSVAVAGGFGAPIAFGARIWQRGVEKVLALREDWMEEHPEETDALLRALDAAGAWCDEPANREELAALLARFDYLAQPAAIIGAALDGRLPLSASGEAARIDDFLLFHREAAGFPWRSQALWIYSQLVRWRFLDHSGDHQAAAARVFRPDIYRRALAGAATPMPGASAKVEGALSAPLPVGSNRGKLTLGADRFFDGRVFDPDRIEEYLAGFVDTVR